MISVVLCSYNGEKYILEQLESIAYQTNPVDEVLIRDDGSTDKTIEICEKFIAKHHLRNWKIEQNQTKKGVFQNFISGLFEAKGDFIFLADQDDIWEKDKVKVMTEVLKQNPQILSLATTFSRMDETGKMIEYHTIHPHRKKGKLKKIKDKEFYQFCYYLGMSMVIRKELLQHINIENELFQSHDILLNFYALLHHGFYFLDRVLTKRRSYEKSASNHFLHTERKEKYQNNLRVQYLDQKRTTLEMFQKILEQEDYSDKNRPKKYIEFYPKRIDYILNKRMITYLLSVTKLHKYESIRDYIKDGKYVLQGERRQ